MVFQYCIVFTFLFGTYATLAGGQRSTADDGDPGDPGEWIVKAYPFSAPEIDFGITDAKGNATYPPELPRGNPEKKTILSFMKESDDFAHAIPQIRDLKLPNGAILLYNPDNRTLTARLPRQFHETLQSAEGNYDSIARTLQFTLRIFEAPSASVVSLLENADDTSDHSRILAALQEEVKNGNASLLFEGRCESNSGERARLEATTDRLYTVPKVIGTPEVTEYTYLSEPEGTSFEIDPVLGANRATIDLNSGLDYNFAPARQRPLPEISANGLTIPNSTTDTFIESIVAQFTLYDDQARILAVWANQATLGALHVAVITPRVLGVIPDYNSILTDYIEEYGKEFRPIPDPEMPKENPTVPEPIGDIPEGMIRNTYVVPPTFLSTDSGGGTEPADPFADPKPTIQRAPDAKEILENAGIAFPEGTFARYIPESNSLVVQNTRDQVELVEAYVGGGCDYIERNIPFTFYIIEGPVAAIDQVLENTAGIADHTDEWNRVRNLEDISIVGVYRVEGRSGQRAKIESVCNYTYPFASQGEEATKSKEKDESPSHGELACHFETGQVGTVIEFDPVLSADEVTIDLNLSFRYDFAPPRISSGTGDNSKPIPLSQLTTEFHKAKFNCQTTLIGGTMRLLGTWEPEGAPRFEHSDLRQAVFLKADIVPLLPEQME